LPAQLSEAFCHNQTCGIIHINLASTHMSQGGVARGQT
jgi:hypothetical protein